MDLIDNFLDRIEVQVNPPDDLDVNLWLEEAFAFIVAMGVDDEDEREPFSWVKITVDINEYRYMEDPSFKLHFRMSRHLFEQLLIVVMERRADLGWKKPKNCEVAHILLMVLWILATPDSFRGVALRFGVTPGVLHFHYRRMIEVLSGLASSYVSWPSAAERAQIERYFEEDTGFPGVVGAIDGTHIYISKPEEDNQRFVNRHGNHSIILQAVCDNSLLFRDVYVGEPGGVHDSRVFRRSPLSALMLEDEALLSPEQHIVGDGAYTLTDKLLKPFRNLGYLTPAQRWYNVCIASTRVVIEQAFGLLKGKWRRLKYMLVKDCEYAVQHVVACVMLHNFLIQNGEPLDEELVNNVLPVVEREDEGQVGEQDANPNVAVEPDHPLLAAARVRGEEKRLHFVELLAHAQ